MIKFSFYFLLVFILSNCSQGFKNSVEVNLTIAKHDEDYYLVSTVINNSNNNIYIVDWNLVNLIVVCDSSNQLVSNFIENEFYFQTHLKKMHFPINNNIIPFDYEDLSSANYLVKKTIDKEFSLMIKNQNLYNLSCDDSLMIKNLLFDKYINSIFIDSKKSVKDSLSVTSLFKNSAKYKVALHYKPKQYIESIKFKINNRNDSISFSSLPLSETSSFILFNETLDGEIFINFN